MEALETELKKLRNEVKEKDFKLLAHEKLKDNHTAECDKKVREMSEECEQKLAAQAKRHELDLAEKTNECQRLLASEKEASEKTLAEQAKSFEGKIEMVTMKLEAKALAEAEGTPCGAGKAWSVPSPRGSLHGKVERKMREPGEKAECQEGSLAHPEPGKGACQGQTKLKAFVVV